ncbi:MAG: hypothetical protein ACI4KR_08605, partial [Ruminiclostridium sp.]
SEKLSISNDGVITVPDSQSLFLLGCITMSGAGSADPDSGEYPGTYSYGNNQMTRHALYNEIGTGEQNGDFAAVLNNDSYDTNAVPYVIYEYTEKSPDNKYSAKSVTNNKCTYSFSFAENGTYQLSPGFRGIGSYYFSADNMQVYVNNISGNGAEIELNIIYYTYRKDYQQYFDNTNNSYSTENCIRGFGLFNSLIQSKGGSIEDLTISGNVKHQVYYSDNSTSNEYSGSQFSCVGGLAGVCNASKALCAGNLTLNLTAESMYYAGGIVGFVRGTELNIKGVSADSLTVGKGYSSGGLIGYIFNCSSDGDGNTAAVFGSADADNKGTITINSVTTNAGAAFNDFFGCGGLIGCVRGNSKVTVENFEIVGADGIDTHINNPTKEGASIGGVIGSAGNNGNIVINFTNISVSKLNIGDSSKKIYSGGFIGVSYGGKGTYFDNCTLIGDPANKNYINGGYVACGFVGVLGTNATINNCRVENYNFVANRESNSVEGAGGFIGKIENNGKTITIKNSVLSDCSISSGEDNGDSKNEEKPVGGIAGAVLSNSNIIGYNVLMNNVKVSRTRSNGINRAGDVIGYIDTGCSFKLVGLSTPKSADGTYMKKDAGTNNGELYLIYADYDGVCLEADCNKTSSPINNTSNVTDMGVFPYVTVNPAVSIDGTNILTGDGVSSTALTNILADIGDSSAESAKAYHNVDSYADLFNSGNLSEKFSTFNDKTGQSIANDFPVLVLNDSSAKITDLLNYSIHLLTNNSDIASYTKSDDRFNIDIACYSYNKDSDVFEREPEEVYSLQINNDYFVMSEDYDSAYNNRFTLIDVQYFAPDSDTEIAYHLYIPVYVEKMLKFDFTIGALSGTRYNSDLYLSVLGEPVLENYGTPVTAYVTYSYLRTAAEWQDAINGGEKLIGSYGKSVLISNGDIFPDSTKIALVDKNNGGKAYYSDMVTASSVVDEGTKLSFDQFTDFSGTNAFSPVSFIELLEKSADITVEPNENGTLVSCTEDEATVKIGGSYYRKKTDTDSGEFYTAAVTPKEGKLSENGILIVEESYYLSFFTEYSAVSRMVNIMITCSSRLDDSGMTPSRMNNAVNDMRKMVHVILGDLYEQSFTFKTTGSEVINDDNRTIYGNLTAVISLKQGTGLIKNYLVSESIHIYHGFIIEATRKEDGTVEKGVRGSPWVSGTYTIGENSYPFDFSNPDSVITIIGKGENGAALDIKDYLKTDDGSVTITCSDLKISYDDDTSIIDQFPERKNGNSENGVIYSAVSNLAYVEDNIGQSTISENAGDTKVYYRDNISTVSLNYDIPAIMPNELTNCGVNGLEKNGEITAVGYYNVVNVPEADLERAKKVKLTLSLYQKDNDKQYIQVDISKYLTGVSINGTSAAKAEEADTFYTVVTDISELTFEADSYEIPTAYSVITGDEFEKELKMY